MLAQLTDRELLSRTKEIVKQEREILIDVIRHLREIDNRRLFSGLKYKSLFEYTVRELGYSEDQAWRRINAMRVTKQVPEVEKKIETGALTLGNLGTASQLFRAEIKAQGSLSKNRQLQVLAAIENKSRREAEQIVQQIALVPTQNLRPERTRQIDDHLEVRINVSPALKQKLQRAKGLLAHKHPYLNTAELLEVLCDQFLTRHESKIYDTRSESRLESSYLNEKPVQTIEVKKETGKLSTHSPSSETKRVPASSPAQPRKGVSIVGSDMSLVKKVSRPIRRQIWRQGKGQCQNCGSTYALEVDHIQPRAQGGSSTLENLRLLCRPCNQRAAIVKLGQATMSVFLGGRV